MHEEYTTYPVLQIYKGMCHLRPSVLERRRLYWKSSTLGEEKWDTRTELCISLHPKDARGVQSATGEASGNPQLRKK